MPLKRFVWTKAVLLATESTAFPIASANPTGTAFPKKLSNAKTEKQKIKAEESLKKANISLKTTQKKVEEAKKKVEECAQLIKINND